MSAMKVLINRNDVFEMRHAMKSELKPCPFCGRTPVIEDCGENRYFVKCKCGIEQGKLYWQRSDAARHWNRRKDEHK